MNEIITSNEDKLTVIGRIHSSSIFQMHEFRGTMARLIFWISGLYVLIIGWLIERNTAMEVEQRLYLTILFVVLFIINIMIIKTFEKYFQDIASVIINCDQVHKSFEIGFYIEDKAIMPEHWSKFGSSKWKEPIYSLSYLAVTLLTITGLLVTWFR